LTTTRLPGGTDATCVCRPRNGRYHLPALSLPRMAEAGARSHRVRDRCGIERPSRPVIDKPALVLTAHRLLQKSSTANKGESMSAALLKKTVRIGVGRPPRLANRGRAPETSHGYPRSRWRHRRFAAREPYGDLRTGLFGAHQPADFHPGYRHGAAGIVRAGGLPRTRSTRRPPKPLACGWSACSGSAAATMPSTRSKPVDLLIQGGGFGLGGDGSGRYAAGPSRATSPSVSWFRLRRAVEYTPTVLVTLARQSNAKTCASTDARMRARGGRLDRRRGTGSGQGRGDGTRPCVGDGARHTCGQARGGRRVAMLAAAGADAIV